MDPRPTASRKVLVVDDSLTVRRSAERALLAGGHEVRLAADGFEALALIHDFAPDLVFCDILMPRLDGYQTCAILKRHPRYAALPVVMLSSRDGVFDVARARLAGASDHLAKPFTAEGLLEAVARHAPSGALAQAR
ncbi:Response regulator MprA [Tepidimonas thermarum]|uniref:Response regulator MprA n=1 Tax=Tepidimonas thermarum TaxID=335431 RepID=A0A554WZA2_9BURK|nr:response regulator [Tepidimonas thermarum]TSE28902.1 Response regulator MprA [Tepidimonas thermarum]